MSSVSQGHDAERSWMKRLAEAGRFACRPRWALVDVLSMKVGDPTYFDEVKTDQDNPFANFKPARRKKFLELATHAGAIPRLVWWPTHGRKNDPGPVIFQVRDWPPTEGAEPFLLPARDASD